MNSNETNLKSIFPTQNQELQFRTYCSEYFSTRQLHVSAWGFLEVYGERIWPRAAQDNPSEKDLGRYIRLIFQQRNSLPGIIPISPEFQEETELIPEDSAVMAEKRVTKLVEKEFESVRSTAECERFAVMSPVTPLDVISSQKPRKRPRQMDEKVRSRCRKGRKRAKVVDAVDEDTIIVEIN